jgi:hypothetical protein
LPQIIRAANRDWGRCCLIAPDHRRNHLSCCQRPSADALGLLCKRGGCLNASNDQIRQLGSWWRLSAHAHRLPSLLHWRKGCQDAPNDHRGQLGCWWRLSADAHLLRQRKGCLDATEHRIRPLDCFACVSKLSESTGRYLRMSK